MFPIQDILSLFPEARFVGKSDLSLSQVIAITDISAGNKLPTAIAWVADKNIDILYSLKDIELGLLIISSDSYNKIETIKNINFLIVSNPRVAFAEILKHKFAKTRKAIIEKTAQVDESVIIDQSCYIGRNVVIEKNVKIGKNVTILHNTVILEDTTIGDNVLIGCNNTIGNYGFGYEKNEEGQYQVIEHIGGVRICDHVHIHNNVCIDRGVLGETYIGLNVKIDNLVHIAHGVRIEKNSLIIANAVIAGSAHIGENCWIAPSAIVKNKISIADNTLLGLGCVVLKNTTPNSTMIGNPAQEIDEFKKQSKFREKLYQRFNTELE